eukprot:TRINITY_DN3446_c0_g1_i2.p1 TRINITY_DN3446_c0_g1~~TRINITY_DN3446_c0_g1_i2.p1  ORF type:complete len:423 (+),score=106.31 TRINITY_DN3446_c0_g1_i2:78-1346(+)
MDARPLDVVIWGATGFTGKLATAYLSGNNKPFYSCKVPQPRAGLRWGVAGRSKEKLQQTLTEYGAPSGTPVFVAEGHDKEAIERFVSQTKVVCALAGPFSKYSNLVVEACVRLGTHYCDITGEVAWHRTLIDRFGEQAARKGACIVPSCGYDSLPSDIGCWCAVQELRRVAGPGAAVRRVRCFQTVHAGGGMGLSGGSTATGIDTELNPVPLPPGVDRDSPFLLGGQPAIGVREEDKDTTEVAFHSDVGMWAGPFMLAGPNRRVVRRSHQLLGYGPQFAYQEVAQTPNETGARVLQRMIEKMPPAHVRAEMVKKGRLPAPGQGPVPEMRAKSFFRSVAIAEAETGEKAWAMLSGGEAGYEETAKMVCEAAITLAKDLAFCTGKGGLLTPASCFGPAIIGPLRHAGIAITTGPGLPKATGAKL